MVQYLESNLQIQFKGQKINEIEFLGLDTYRCNECNLILIVLQSYFMGCSFDNFSTSWWDRSYVITLLILAWFIPLVIIFISHIGILYRVRHSNIKDMLIKKLSCALNSNGAHRRTLREAMLCSRDSRSDSIDRDDLPHVIKRVSSIF